MSYAELQVTSNFSFLRGASHAEELVEAAAALGHAALALTDRNTLAGVVRGHLAAKRAGLQFIVGARLDLGDAPSLLCLPHDRAAYGQLARLLTLGQRRAPKGQCHLSLTDVAAHRAAHSLIVVPPDRPDSAFAAALAALRRTLPGPLYLAAQHLYRGDDAARIAHLAALAERAATPLVATNDVHAHGPERRPLQDVLTCIREHCTIAEAGFRLHANAERHLKPAAEMLRLFRGHEAAVERTLAIAAACRFNLEELCYEYPDEVAPGGDPQAALEALTWAGAAERYGEAVPAKVQRLLERELKLIGTLRYAPYFLTVHDIVRFARSQGILCQGRGSAANSAVCYCLGVTAVDPNRIDLLFERFLSAERNEPPDIDVDFEHERREEVIQYIYRKYGRERAGLAATLITYRSRGAIREVAKALGLSADVASALNGTMWGSSGSGLDAARVREAGLDPTDPTLARALALARELLGFPRHLSQHVGGFVITRGPLCELVPIQNAAMAERTVIEWDKDDIDALGILKVDCLGLGMLTCIRKAFALIAEHHGRVLDLATVPAEDGAVYDMLCRADSVGVFQVESRAQMSMLPRLKPRNFYDLVIEVAIVRPGPIQGDMVHPYLRRRRGEESVSYPSPALEAVLGKTLGVPLFQEQAMKIAIVAAGFTPAEADKLRRAMATFRRTGQIHHFRGKLIEGMVARGYERDFAERCFRQIEGFGEYGFPESHAASFALLVYVSAWLKCHYPAAFACALLNSQPMGFYAPAQIVRDAREHGVAVLPVDVNHSRWDCTLEPALPAPGRSAAGGTVSDGSASGGVAVSDGVALRLGLREIKGLAEDAAEALVAARRAGRFGDVAELWRRARLAPAVLDRLAQADAFRSLGLSRRQALWAVQGLGPEPLPLFAAAAAAATAATESLGEPERGAEPAVALPTMPLGEEVINDYAALRLTLRAHPLALLRTRLAALGYRPHEALARTPPGRRVRIAGLVICRQRPGTASGVIFMTLEDETTIANLIVWPRTFERYRKAVLQSRLIGVAGTVEREGIVIHV
ncbi:MAG: error-prone DNA polymerase, partial [Alphaproteobacteria bacterium]|nr:error-prone DNA polymerase [Alphaproteobacteria bacterium]